VCTGVVLVDKIKSMTNTTSNKVIRTKRESFIYNNALQYLVVDADTNKILATAYLPTGHGSSNIWEISVGGNEVDAEEVMQTRFGKMIDAVQKEYYGKRHPNYKGILNPAYKTRSTDHTDSNALILKVAYLKTLLLELVQDSDTSPSNYYGTFTRTI